MSDVKNVDNLPSIQNANQLFKLMDYSETMEPVTPAEYDRLFDGVKHERVERPENGVTSTASQDNILEFKLKSGCLDCFESYVRLNETLKYDGTNGITRSIKAVPEASWSEISSMSIYVNDSPVVVQNNFGQYLHDRIIKKFSKNFCDCFGQIWGVIPNSNTTSLNSWVYNSSAITADSNDAKDVVNVIPVGYGLSSGATSLGCPNLGAGLPTMNYGEVIRNDIASNGTGVIDKCIPLWILHDFFEKMGVIIDPRIETIKIVFKNSATPGVSYVKYNGSAQTVTINYFQVQLLFHEPSDHCNAIRKAFLMKNVSSVYYFDDHFTADGVCTNGTTSLVLSNRVQAPISHTAYFYTNSNEVYTSRYIYQNPTITKKIVRIDGKTVQDGTLAQDWSTNQIVEPYNDLLRVLNVDSMAVGDSFFTYQNFPNLFPCQATKLSSTYKRNGAEGYKLDPTPKLVEIELTGSFVSTQNLFQVMVCENAMIVSPDKTVFTLFNVGKSSIATGMYK